MTTLLITRHFSRFGNVEDRFTVGDREYEGDAAASEYRVPEGYTLDGDTIRDPEGYECGIFPGKGDAPVLISMAGPVPDAVLIHA